MCFQPAADDSRAKGVSPDDGDKLRSVKELTKLRQRRDEWACQEVPRHSSVTSKSVPSTVGGGVTPRCRQAPGVAIRPRGVRAIRPFRTKKGSATTSTVSGSSPTATASVDNPTGPPPHLR